MDKFIERLKNIGPGALVAAAFIGPGTVTTCSKSGASSGYTLLWAMLFSTIATIIFQEMAARLGIATQKGLGENIREKIVNPVLRAVAVVIVIVAIFVGNTAYETGNLTGGIMGITTVMPQLSAHIVALVLGVLAFLLLWSGSYKSIEKMLTALVLIMSFAFIGTAIASKPDFLAIIKGLFTPKAGANDWMTVVGLIGTTVVPYNLFLHASSAAERWKDKSDIKNARIDTVVSIGLGGIVSMCIIIAAAANCQGMNINNGADMAVALEPLVGVGAKWCIGIGLLAAGFSSAITAPLSAAFATQGILGMNRDMKNFKFKIVWIIVLIFGTVLAVLGHSSPTQLILVAQAANAIILPIMALFLIYCVNSKKLGEYKNGVINNILGIIIILVTIAICVKNMTSFITSLQKLLG